MEELYTYLGYAIIVVLIYLIFKTIFASKQPEGFFGMSSDKKDDTKDDTKEDTTDDDNLDTIGKQLENNVTQLEAQTNQIIKQMHIVEDRKHWENLIIALEDKINIFSIRSMAMLMPMLLKEPEDEKILTAIEKLNTLNKYKQTLKDNMIYLDGLA